MQDKLCQQLRQGNCVNIQDNYVYMQDNTSIGMQATNLFRESDLYMGNNVDKQDNYVDIQAISHVNCYK